MSSKQFSVFLTLCIFTFISLFGYSVIFSNLNISLTNSKSALGLSNYIAQSTCQEPSSGCGDNYYWDDNTCSCVYKEEETTSTCSEPSGGCGDNYYWDDSSCSCVYAEPTPECTQPSEGCGENYYWDSYYCSCLPYETDTCTEPSSGCGDNYYWDSSLCSCKAYEQDYCTEPSSGCGEGMYWDYYSCSCMTSSLNDFTDTFDRLAYESQERINCVKSILTDIEYQTLRYLIPSTAEEEIKIHNLGDKVASCWGMDSYQKYDTSSEIYTSGYLLQESCIINAIGKTAFQDISEGKRSPTHEEHLWFEECYGETEKDTIVYKTLQDDLTETEICIKSLLGNELYQQVIDGKVDVPIKYQGGINKCFGADPQPFEESPRYEIPESVKQCLVQAVGQVKFEQIDTGQSEPTEEEKEAGETCFSQINDVQTRFLPAPPSQVPYLEENQDEIELSGFLQERKKHKNKTIGGKITFSGSGPANSQVTIYIYSEPIVVKTTTDENGDWVYELTKPLEGEKHIAYATVKTKEGQVVRSSIFNFEVLAASDEPTTTAYVDESKATPVQDEFIKVVFVGLSIIVAISLAVVAWVNIKRYDKEIKIPSEKNIRKLEE